jgi:hypothetical protein
MLVLAFGMREIFLTIDRFARNYRKHRLRFNSGGVSETLSCCYASAAVNCRKSKFNQFAAARTLM